MTTPKSATGHLLGAAGAVEAIFSALAIRDQILPATLNLDAPGEGCELDFVPHKRQRVKQATADLADLEITGVSARGRRLAPKPVARIRRLRHRGAGEASPEAAEGSVVETGNGDEPGAVVDPDQPSLFGD